MIRWADFLILYVAHHASKIHFNGPDVHVIFRFLAVGQISLTYPSSQRDSSVIFTSLPLSPAAKMKKKLLESAPWRDEPEPNKFEDAKLKMTNQPGTTPTMHVPRKKSLSSKSTDDDDSIEIDPELRYSFQRNVQVFLFRTHLFIYSIC